MSEVTEIPVFLPVAGGHKEKVHVGTLTFGEGLFPWTFKVALDNDVLEQAVFELLSNEATVGVTFDILVEQKNVVNVGLSAMVSQE